MDEGAVCAFSAPFGEIDEDGARLSWVFCEDTPSTRAYFGVQSSTAATVPR